MQLARATGTSREPAPGLRTMSYILDALKKADAERERSPVPGLNAHDGGFGIADRRDGPPWRAIAIGTGGGAGGGAGVAGLGPRRLGTAPPHRRSPCR
jgi:hypothetical protein